MQVQAQTPFDARVGTPVGATPERRTGWMWFLLLVLGAAVLALGATVVYPALITTQGEAAMNDVMDAWNSGDVAAFPDVYAPEATIVLSTGESYSGLDEITAAARDARSNGLRVERTGPVTESGNLIAYPATVTTGTDTQEAMFVLRYDDAGMILEHQIIVQTP